MKKTVLLSMLGTMACIAAIYTGIWSVSFSLGCIGLSWIAVYVVYTRTNGTPSPIIQRFPEPIVQPSQVPVSSGPIVQPLLPPTSIGVPVPSSRGIIAPQENNSQPPSTLDRILNWVILHKKDRYNQKKTIQSFVYCIFHTETLDQRLLQYAQITQWAMQHKEYDILVSIIYKIPKKNLFQFLISQETSLFRWACMEYCINKNKIPQLILNKMPRTDIIQLLKSFTFETPESKRHTCFTWTIQNNQMKLLALFLEKMPEVNRLGFLGADCLFHANLFNNNKEEVVPAFAWAIKNNHFVLLDLLLKALPENNKLGLIIDSFKGSFSYAFQESILMKTNEDRQQIMSLFLKYNLHKAVISSNGNTLLLLFIQLRITGFNPFHKIIFALIDFLVRHGSAINHVNTDGRTALSYCLRGKYYSRVSNSYSIQKENAYDAILLLDHGSDARLLPAYKQSRLLAKVIERHQIGYARFLLEDAAIGFTVEQKQDFLYTAIKSQFIFAVELLVKHLNNPRLLSIALIKAVRSPDFNLETDEIRPRVIEEKIIALNLPRPIAGVIVQYAMDPLVAIIYILIENKVDIDFQTQHDDTALSLSVKKDCINVVKLLLKKGAQVTPRALSSLGDSSIHKEEMLKLLLDKESENETVVCCLSKEKTKGILFHLNLFRSDCQEQKPISVDTTKVVDLIADYCCSKKMQIN